MPTATIKPVRPPQTSIQLSPPARGALKRIKKHHGITHTRAIERGVIMLENFLATHAGSGVAV